MRHGTAVNDGVRIAYEVHERAGGAPWLVLVHGLGYARWGWEPVVEPLAEHYRLVLLDNRGIGRSDVPAGPYDSATMAGDVLAVLDDLGLDRVHLLGTSLGGMIAQEVALTAPDRIERLVLVCTTPGGERAYPLPEATLTLLREMPDLPPEQALRRAVVNALADETAASRPEVVERILDRRRATPQDPAGWQAQAAAGASHARGCEVGGIAAPTLILHGDADRVVDPRNAAILGELVDDSQVVVLPGLGHLLFWDDPGGFVREVVAFLGVAGVREVDTRSASHDHDN